MIFYKGAAEKLKSICSMLLQETFTWSNSMEGHEYWAQVQRRLEDYRDQAFEQEKNKESCKEDIAQLRRRLEELEDRCK